MGFASVVFNEANLVLELSVGVDHRGGVFMFGGNIKRDTFMVFIFMTERSP